MTSCVLIFGALIVPVKVGMNENGIAINAHLKNSNFNAIARSDHSFQLNELNDAYDFYADSHYNQEVEGPGNKANYFKVDLAQLGLPQNLS